jgi:hypothetical protein
MIKNFHFSDAANAPDFTYAPAANRIEARRVMSATREASSRLDFYAGSASGRQTA